METILKYESRIQEFLVSTFLLTIMIAFIAKINFFSWALIVEFFLIATFQYSINLIKFLSKGYTRTDSRYVYVFLSSYVVIGFIIWMLFSVFDVNKESISLKNIFELMAISWIILSPILIIQSLLISYSDKNFKNEKSNH